MDLGGRQRDRIIMSCSSWVPYWPSELTLLRTARLNHNNRAVSIVSNPWNEAAI